MRTKYTNTAFFVELLVNVLVFSISCSILVGIFANAFLTTRTTNEKNLAANEAYALLATVRAQGLAPQLAAQGEAPLMYRYDENWNPVTGEDGKYIIRLELEDLPTDVGRLTHVLALALNAEGQEICRLETDWYHPAEGGTGP